MNASIVATARDAAQSAITTPVVSHGSGTEPATVQANVGPSKGRRLRRRHLWLIPGLAIALYANVLGNEHEVGILALVAFGIAPDLPRWLARFLGGYAPVARSIANLLHQPLVALAAFAFAAAGAVNGIIPMIVLVATLIWVSHVIIGWGVGDGIRHEEPAVRP